MNPPQDYSWLNNTLLDLEAHFALPAQTAAEALEAAKATITSKINQIRLEELERLEADSDCLEDGCGLDAELLRENLLRRINTLKNGMGEQ